MFFYELADITQQAALACFPWIGRGEKETADLAAVNAVRSAGDALTQPSIIVVGEGEKDKAPQLYAGERLGPSCGDIRYDIAVDPLECTSYLAKGLPNALSVIGVSRYGTMYDPGPAFYMDKLVVPPVARGLVTPDMPIGTRLQKLALALQKDVAQLSIYVLDRPRNSEIIKQIYQSGAKALVYSAGDVVGAVLAASDDERVDSLMGTGGSTEGIIASCAVKALGGDLFAKIDPQLEKESKLVAEAGISTSRWLELHELISGKESHFCATGITGGLWLRAVEKNMGNSFTVESCIVSSMLDTPLFVRRAVFATGDGCTASVMKTDC